MKKWFEKLWGELNKIRILKSLKFRIAILILFTGVVCLFGMRFGILRNYFSRAVEVRTSDVRSQMQILADHLLSYNYLEDPSSGIVNAEIEQIANLYDGRVMVIGPNFSVIKDTYGLSTGKYMISEEVIKTFRGDFISHYDDVNSYIEITVPINRISNDKSETVGVILASVSTVPINQNEEILSRNSLLFMFLLFLLVGAAAIFMPLVMLKPFDRVSDAISEAKSGFTDKKIEVNDYIETEHIVDSFNQVMDRMRVIEESREEFVSNVSHELKTPLTSIKVLADSLNTQDDVPVEIYKEFMSDIANEIDRETVIINDLLSLVKMDKKSASLNITQINVNSLIETIFKRLLPIAQINKVDLIFESLRQVNAEIDEVKFSLAITNLIENGIKYNKEGGFVKVSLDADYQNFIITVTDSGIGIPEEELKSIFERFYRVDKSHSREIGGTGLGLSITRSAILLHRGSIAVESSVGEGTTFTVKVPIMYNQTVKERAVLQEKKEQEKSEEAVPEEVLTEEPEEKDEKIEKDVFGGNDFGDIPLESIIDDDEEENEETGENKTE